MKYTQRLVTIIYTYSRNSDPENPAGIQRNQNSKLEKLEKLISGTGTGSHWNRTLVEPEQEVSVGGTGSQIKQNRNSWSEEELCSATLPIVLLSKWLRLQCGRRPLHQRVRWGRGSWKPRFLQPFVSLLVFVAQFSSGPGVIEPVFGCRPLDGVLDVVQLLAGCGSDCAVVEGIVVLE